MRLAWRRRKVRSWETTTTAPGKRARVSSKKRIEGRSRWLVGSSSSSTSGRASRSFASSTRISQPPLKLESGRVSPLVVEAEPGEHRSDPRVALEAARQAVAMARERRSARSSDAESASPSLAAAAHLALRSRRFLPRAVELGQGGSRLVAHAVAKREGRSPGAACRCASCEARWTWPAVDGLLAEHHPQQRRLARAVRSDDADAIAGAEHQRDAAKEHAVADRSFRALRVAAARRDPMGGQAAARGRQNMTVGARAGQVGSVGDAWVCPACCGRDALSRQVQYALCGIFDLAYNGAGEPVHVRRIGERQRIPRAFLEQIFQRLRRAGLVTGKRGPGGGFLLTRPPSQISLREVVEAIEGPIVGEALARLAREASGGAGGDGGAVHRPDFLWDDLADRFAGLLGEIRVADVCREAVRRSVARDLPTRFDYEI